jgi:hypothetical protein
MTNRRAAKGTLRGDYVFLLSAGRVPMPHPGWMADYQNSKSAPCPRCGAPMRLVRTVPKLREHPELLTFRCSRCGEVETKEA